jgi:hypothetical protein
MTRFVVMILHGGMDNANQNGVTMRRRMNIAIKAGLVVALVGVLCVLKKSVNSNRGSRSTLQRPVSSFRVSTISSSVF